MGNAGTGGARTLCAPRCWKRTLQFSRAATTQNDVPAAAEWAERSLATTVDAMDALADEYAEQALDTPPRPAAADSPPGSASTWATSCRSANVARQLSSAVQHGVGAAHVADDRSRRRPPQLERGRRPDRMGPVGRPARSCGGPLLELDDRGVPDWTYLWEGDFDSLLAFMLDHVRAVVEALSRQSAPLASGRRA